LDAANNIISIPTDMRSWNAMTVISEDGQKRKGKNFLGVFLNNIKTDELLQKAVNEIAANHRKIIDDWCKAYMAQLYEEGIELKPECFILYEQQEFEHVNGKLCKKYWFEKKGGKKMPCRCCGAARPSKGFTEKAEDHPFPNKELELLMKLNSKGALSKEDFEVISELLHKYLNLRADVFHKI
jgi:hypothetical protein